MPQVVVTQLIVDASGAQKGVADFEAAMDKAKKAANENGVATASAFERAQQKWQQSLAATDPVIRAQIQMQQALARQQAINTEAVKLGITTQQAAAAQLDRVNQKYQAYVDKAGQAGTSSSNLSGILEKLSGGFSKIAQLAGALGLVFSVGAIVQFGKSVFMATADLQEQADQILGAGGNVEALQAFRGIFLTNGIAMDAGDKIIAKLTRSLGEAAQGSKQAQDAFHLLGLGSKQLAGSTADAALPLVAQKLLDIKDASARAAIETTLFGKSGQQLESALSSLAHPLDDLIAHAKSLGIVIDEDMIKKADDAKDRMALAWAKLSVTLAPIITNWVDGFVNLTDKIDGTTTAMGSLLDKIGLIASILAGARVGAFFGLPGAVVGAGVGASAYLYMTEGTGGISAEEAAQRAANGTLYAPSLSYGGAANSTPKSGGGSIAGTPIDAGQFLGGGAAAASVSHPPPAKQWAPTPEDIAAYAKIKETFAGYLDELKQAADVSKLSASEKQIEANVIKAAVIDEKAHGVAARDTSKTYADAVKYLGDQKAHLVEILTIQAQINAFTQQQNDDITVANAGLAVDADHRTLVLKNIQDELKLGILVGDQYAEQRKTLEEKNATIQDITDATKTRDYLDNLKEETSLAGMSADERERESAVLQVMHMNNGKITDDLANQVRGAISLKQQMQQVGSAVSGIETADQSLAEGFLNHSKNILQTWFDAVKEQYIKLLAWMATQAVINPIVVPIFEGLVGSTLGLSTSGVSGSSPLGQAGAASSMLGQVGTQLKSAVNWFTGGLNNLGTSLGFSASGAGSLTSALGNAGLGYMLGSAGASLFGGNASSAQQTNGMIGSALGAAVGSIIPGLGTLLGSALGGLIGGLFGPKESAHRATANFDTNYALTSVTGTKMTSEGQTAATSAGQSVSQVVEALQGAGLTLTNNIQKLTISTARDKSFITTSSGQRIDVGPVGDTQAAVKGTLKYLFDGLKSGDKDVQQVIAHYKAIGGLTADNAQQFGDDVTFAQNMKTATHAVTVQLGNAADALAQVQAAYDTDIARAKSLGLSTAELIADQQKDIAAMQKQTSDAYVAQFQSVTQQLGPQLDSYQSAAKALSDGLAQATSDMTALGGSLADVTAASNAANAALAATFNADMKSQLEGITNPVTSAFNTLLASEKQRVTDATTVGGDLAQVNALNNAEMQKYIASLSDADRATLVSAGVLTSAQVAFSNSITQVSDGIDTLIGTMTDTVQAAQQASQAWTSAKQALDQASTALQVSGPGVPPQNAYLAAQQQFSDLKTKALNGDAQSASDLANFASQFLQTSLAYNATGPQYGSDFQMVQNVLAQVSQFSGTQATAADKLAAQAQASLDALNAMKDQLASGNPSLPVLQDQLKVQQDLSATMDAVLGQLGGHRAAGGAVTAGKSYLVGEYRAEMFTPSTSGYVSPNISMPVHRGSNDNEISGLKEEVAKLREAILSSNHDATGILKLIEIAVRESGGDQTKALTAVKRELFHANGMTSLGAKRKRKAG